MSDLGMVSVVIPAFNSAKYLQEAIGSVLSQSYRNSEVLVIDDGSTDDTRGVVEAIRDPRVRYIPMDQRRGNYFARNKGLAEARGSFFAFLDADDLWAEGKLQKQMSVFERCPEVGMCVTDHLLFDDQDKTALTKDHINTYPDDGSDYGRFLKRLLVGNFLITASVVARRECFDRLGPFDTTFQNAMDYDMWLRIALNYKTYYLAEPLVLKRVHRGNISRNKVTSFKAVSYILEKVLSAGAGNKFYEQEMELIVRQYRKRVQYTLGLEYIEARDFENAIICLKACQLPEKAFARRIALLAAQTRFGPLLALVRLYRKKRGESQVRPIKSSSFRASLV